MEIKRTDDAIRVIYSSRRTLSISIETDGTVLVRAPQGMPLSQIQPFLAARDKWIEEHRRRALERSAALATRRPYTKEELSCMKRQTRRLLDERLPLLAATLGVRYTGVSVRFQRTRYGSCSARGHVSFNATLCCMPRSVADYVMIHELSHLRHMDHSAAFWACVGAACPTYREARAFLRAHGYEYLDRLPNGRASSCE